MLDLFKLVYISKLFQNMVKNIVNLYVPVINCKFMIILSRLSSFRFGDILYKHIYYMILSVFHMILSVCTSKYISKIQELLLN